MGEARWKGDLIPVLLPEALLVLFLLSASINGTTCGIGEMGAGTAIKR
jgi:hypothetical protein